MSQLPDPWAEIQKPSNGMIKRRRVAGSFDDALYWYRDDTGHIGLLLEIPGDMPLSRSGDASFTSRDISVDVRMADQGINILAVRLEDSLQKDVFRRLCDDLVDRVVNRPSGTSSFDAIVARLKRWQELLSQAHQRFLSLNQVRGLFAELTFMSELLDTGTLSEFEVANGWYGPERTQHDFVLSDRAIEVKSVAGHERDEVRISSEDQLDTHLDQLLLRVYFLADVSDDSDTESLNDIVSRLKRRFGRDAKAADCFESRLAEYGYIDIAHYDNPKLRVKEQRTYEVGEGFPRLSRAALPRGVANVTYDLQLSAIEEFRTGGPQFKG